MKEREFKDLTVWAIFREIALFGALIGGHYWQIKPLMNGVIWLLWFIAVINTLATLLNSKAVYQYSKRKYQFDVWTQTLLGAVLAGYGYYFLASILTFFSLAVIQRSYFEGKDE